MDPWTKKDVTRGKARDSVRPNDFPRRFHDLLEYAPIFRGINSTVSRWKLFPELASLNPKLKSLVTDLFKEGPPFLHEYINRTDPFSFIDREATRFLSIDRWPNFSLQDE